MFREKRVASRCAGIQIKRLPFWLDDYIRAKPQKLFLCPIVQRLIYGLAGDEDADPQQYE
jgi:hypothetical protein